MTLAPRLAVVRGVRTADALLAALVAVTFLAAATAHAADLTGKVIGITDGDTLTVLINREPVKVRLAEITRPSAASPGATAPSRPSRTRCSANRSSS